MNLEKVPYQVFFDSSLNEGFISETTPVELVQIIWQKLKPPEQNGEKYIFYAPWPFCATQGKEVTVPSGFQKEGEQIMLKLKFNMSKYVPDGTKLAEIRL